MTDYQKSLEEAKEILHKKEDPNLGIIEWYEFCCDTDRVLHVTQALLHAEKMLKEAELQINIIDPDGALSWLAKRKEIVA